APAALADVGALDGLDARSVWPPLLRPGVLMDPDSYGAWERRAIAVLTTADSGAAALDAIDTATRRIAAWRPGPQDLRDVVHASFDQLGHPAGTPTGDEAAIGRWLAARLFGCWTAYQSDGLHAIVRHLRTCFDTFTLELARDGSAFEAVRRSDLSILH